MTNQKQDNTAAPTSMPTSTAAPVAKKAEQKPIEPPAGDLSNRGTVIGLIKRVCKALALDMSGNKDAARAEAEAIFKEIQGL